MAAPQPVSAAVPVTSSLLPENLGRATLVVGLSVSMHVTRGAASAVFTTGAGTVGASTIGPGSTDGGPSGTGTTSGVFGAGAGVGAGVDGAVSWNITSASWIEPSAGL